jgi:hypothetical protein
MIGGRYRPLDESDVQRIHAAALDALERIGLSEAIPSCIEAVTAAGGELSPEGRLLFPRALVEDTVANAARDFVLHGQDPRHDMELAGNKVYFGTAGAAVHMVDPRTREYRESNLRDLYEVFTYGGFWSMARRHRKTSLPELRRSFDKRAFTRELQRLIPEIQSNDLVYSGAGVRAQAVSASGKLVDDFVIAESDGAVHVLNAPSPGATSSLGIADAICRAAMPS